MPRMGVIAAFKNGFARVWRAPSLVAGIWLSTVIIAWPLALMLRGMLAVHLGTSVAADTAASAVNFDWWNEFLSQAAGIGQTFVPAILGFAAVLKNISSVADAQGVPIAIAGAIATNVAVSVFLMGGVLDRLARDRHVGAYGFFAACGNFFFRYLRLGVIAGAVYLGLFTWLHPLLFDRAYTALTHDLTVERMAMMYRALLYLAFGIVLVVVNVLFDYAKVRMAVEDRRSTIAALTAAARFVARNAGAVFALYLLNLLIFVAVLATYALVASGAAGGAAAWIGFFIGQLYIVARVTVRLAFSASEIALFQGRLAHAGYTAAPIPTWPDSPAAEAISPQ